jgi:hypothetical protein
VTPSFDNAKDNPKPLPPLEKKIFNLGQIQEYKLPDINLIYFDT